MKQQAQDALALMTHLGVKRAHVIGHSFGGAVAAQLAIEAPSLVRSLVVLEPAIMPPDPTAAFVEAFAGQLAAYRSGDVARAVDLFLSAVSAPDWRSAAANTVPGGPEQAEKDGATFFGVEFRGFEKWSSDFDSDRASRISQPVLLVIGSESGPLFEAAKQHFQSLIPHTEQVVVPGVDHLMQMRDAKLVAAHIADFLSRQPL